MEYTIEKNIPISPRKGSLSVGKYPLQSMEIGDSFLIKEYDKKLALIISAYARFYGKRYMNGAKFSIRKTFENQLRVWRVK